MRLTFNEILGCLRDVLPCQCVVGEFRSRDIFDDVFCCSMVGDGIEGNFATQHGVEDDTE